MTARSASCLGLSSLVLLAAAGCPPPGNGTISSVNGNCPAGSVAFPGTVLDGCATLSLGANVPLEGVKVSTLQPFSTTATNSGGQFVACLRTGQPTTLQFTLAGYETTYLAEFSLTAPPPTVDEVALLMLCSSAVSNYASFLPTFDKSLATVFGLVNPGLGSGVAGCDGGFAAGQLDGWTFSASLVGGGVPSEGPWPVGYIDASGDLQGIDATFDTGEAVVFNVDPAVAYVALQGVNPALGVAFPAANKALGLTGRVYVAAGAFSYDPWVVPGLNAFECPGANSAEVCPATGPCTIASGQVTPLAIALDATSVYWTDQGSGAVMKAPLGGGSPTEIGSSTMPYGIAVDSSNVYWADYYGAVVKAPLAGGNPTALASEQSGPYGIAVDAQNVYWTNYLGGTVMKVPIAGGNPVALASGQVAPSSLAVDSQNVYWTNNGTAASGYTDGTVMEAPLAGGNATALATGLPGPLGIAVDSSAVYFATYGTVATGGGSIYKSPLGVGAALITLASDQPGPAALAIDATSVYWTNLGDPGTLMAVPLGGGSLSAVATGQNTPAAMAAGPSGVYWTDWGGGTVMKVVPENAAASGTTSGGASSSGSIGSGSTSGVSGSGGGTTSGGATGFSGTSGGSGSSTGGTTGACSLSNPPDAGCLTSLPGTPDQELQSCNEGLYCGCPLACVSDQNLYQFGGGPIVCERDCCSNGDCDVQGTSCQNDHCSPNICFGGPNGTLTPGQPCDVVGTDDGTCEAVSMVQGFLVGICVLGSATPATTCDPSTVTNTPGALCSVGSQCVPVIDGTPCYPSSKSVCPGSDAGLCLKYCSPSDGGCTSPASCMPLNIGTNLYGLCGG